MRSVAVIAMVGAIAFALSGTAAARGGGGGGPQAAGGFHGGGMHASGGSGMSSAMPSRSIGGGHFAMNNNLRSNRGSLRRGQERAAYVHPLNSQRRTAGTNSAINGSTTRTTGTNVPIRGAAPSTATVNPPAAGGGAGTNSAVRAGTPGTPATNPPAIGGTSGPAIPPAGLSGTSQAPSR